MFKKKDLGTRLDEVLGTTLYDLAKIEDECDLKINENRKAIDSLIKENSELHRASRKAAKAAKFLASLYQDDAN